MKMSIVLIFLYLFSAAHTWTLAQGWQGIIPLHSTRQDVEKLFNSKSQGGLYDKFKVATDIIYITYTTGRCEKEEVGGWNVPIGTVSSIQVFPQSKVSFSGLNLNLDKFKISYTDVVGVRIYSNEEDGFEVEMYGPNDAVARFTYFPSAKDWHLRCPTQAIKTISSRPCLNRNQAFDPSGSYYFMDNSGSIVLQVFGIFLDLKQEGGKFIASGAVISLAGTEFKFSEAEVSRDAFTFNTESVNDVQYSFNGNWLINDGVFFENKLRTGAALLKGTLKRVKAGKVSSANQELFTYRPECYSR